MKVDIFKKMSPIRLVTQKEINKTLFAQSFRNEIELPERKNSY